MKHTLVAAFATLTDANRTRGDLMSRGIPEEAARVHGITTEQALAEGRPLRDVLDAFVSAVESADLLVAHNLRFDEKIVGAELLRLRLPLDLEVRPRVCTMLECR